MLAPSKLAQIDERDPQIREMLLQVQETLREAKSRGRLCKVVFPFHVNFGGRDFQLPWNGPAISTLGPLSKSGAA